MPPSLSPSLLKAVTVPFHHHHPPVIYGIKKPPHMLGRSSLPRSLNEAIKRTAATPGIINGIAGRGGRKGAARFAGEGWWMGSGIGHAPFPAAADEGLTGGRRWVGGGPARAGGGGAWSSDGRVGGDETQEQVMGSLLQYQQNEEGGVEVNGSCKKDQQQDSPRLLTLPTVLTLGRVAAVPLLVTTYHMNAWWATTATTSIFLAAAFTDWLDGYIARKMRLGTAFGAFLDPVADKLMVATTLILLCTKPLEFSIFGDVPWILTVPSIAIIGREITMSAVREWAASQNSTVLEAVAVNNLGKWKTATQMTALTILLAARDPSLTGSAAVVASGVLLLYISAGLAVWSLVVYMSKIWRILLK